MSKRNIIILSAAIILVVIAIVVIVLVVPRGGTSPDVPAASSSGNTESSEYRVPLSSDDMITVTPAPASSAPSEGTADESAPSVSDQSTPGSEGSSSSAGDPDIIDPTSEGSQASHSTPTPKPKPAGPTKDPYEGEHFTDF